MSTNRSRQASTLYADRKYVAATVAARRHRPKGHTREDWVLACRVLDIPEVGEAMAAYRAAQDAVNTAINQAISDELNNHERSTP